MDDQEFSTAIMEIVHRLMEGPESHRTAFLRLLTSFRISAAALSQMGVAAGDMRLYLKYLTFDLEATRRERDELKQMLEGGA